jgi:predicted O-linked N-acetylglucosamine transferase (SPINDLY family)
MGKSIGEPASRNARLSEKQGAGVAQLFERALTLHQSGLLPDAKAVYRQLLKLAPNHFNALYLLGRLEFGAQSYRAAEALLSQAVQADPQSADAHMHRGVALNALGRHDDARLSYQHAIALKPDDAIALNNLGNVCRSLGRLEEAVEAYDKAIAVRKDIAETHYNRGLVLSDLSRHEEAVESFDRALAINPRYPGALSDRGNALCWLGHHAEALASFDQALAMSPGFADAHNGRGVALTRLRDYRQAYTSLERALAIRPDYADALANRATVSIALAKPEKALADLDRAIALVPTLASAWAARADALLEMNRVSDAIASCERAIALPASPGSTLAVVVLGQCLARLGQANDAIASFDAALAIEPSLEIAISNKIFSLDFADDASFESHREARRVWWEQVGAQVATSPPYRHSNNRDPARRLVLGYVSSDFRQHSAALAFRPVLRRHDKTSFEIVCYSCSPRCDNVTEEFRRIADRWRDASQWSDEQLTAQIREDAIDILIDLSGHTGGNRLGVFARKPAPVQVHGWGNITPPGLPTIDYVFADPVAIPPEVRHLFDETIYDLPCILTVEPLPPGVSHAETPALANGFVTFGVFNRISKISDASAELWSRILVRVPKARLLIKHSTLDDPVVGGNLLARFARYGAPAERIDLMGSTARVDHLSALNRVDICLDPFPANGGASTWEALQMGVPVIARLGKAQTSRAAGAILTAVGLGDWVADSDEAYLEIAVARASQIAALAELRRALPARVAASAAGNAALYGAAVENAYRSMWRAYCARSADSAT